MSSTVLEIADVINVDELLTRCMGNVGIAERILTKFQERFGIDLSELEKGISEQDASTIAQAAHRIKGASANVSAPALFEISSEIERLARAEQIAGIPVAIQRLRTEWTRFLDGVSSVDLSQCVPR